MTQAPIPFTKMSAVGNDFIFVDNRLGILDPQAVPEIARGVCRRRHSLGGDELMLIEPPIAGGDFLLRTINPDGAEVNMCGNAARCAARYAFLHGLAAAQMTIDTLGGPVLARVTPDGAEAQVRLQVTAAAALDCPLSVGERSLIVNSVEISGGPHVVLYQDGVAALPAETVAGLGAAIRRHPAFPLGTNVNFVETLDAHTLWQRTYERGVEGETLACGSGAVASTVISALHGRIQSPVRLHVPGGELSVAFRRDGDELTEIWLGGAARFIADGLLHPESLLGPDGRAI